MTNASKILITVVAISVICILQCLVNFKKNRRIRQLPLFVLSILLMIAGVCVLAAYSSDIDNLVNKVQYLNNSTLFISNLALLIAVVIIKSLLLPILSLVSKKKEIVRVFSLSFYEYDEDYDEWFLRKTWANYRKYVFSLIIALFVICCTFLSATWVLGKDSIVWMVIFPAAVLAVLVEFYNYINGQTKEEFLHSVLGTDADFRRVSNYYKIREIFEQLLPSPILSANTGNEFIQRESCLDYLKQLEASEEDLDRITAEYFELNDRYKTADVDCVQATVGLMHGKNTIFFNPFYKDLGLYLTLPIVHTLLSGKKALILCGKKNNAEDIKEWLSKITGDYMHMSSLWRVRYLSEVDPNCEIGIMTFSQLYDKNVINTNKEFFLETKFVLMIEPSIILNTSQIALSIIADEMSQDGNQPTYCISDRYVDGLIDTLSHVLRQEFTDAIATPVPRCTYTGMSWNVDGDYCRQQLFDKQTKYLGNGVELAAIAIKNQIPKVTWYGESKAPLKDIKWIASQYYSTICRYMNQPSQQRSIYEKIDFVPMLWNSEKKKEQFIIAEDEYYNMFGAMRAFLSRGDSQVFVNIMSENYLLRDYMRCNRQLFMSNPNAVPSFVPDYAKTERNTIIKLILLMVLRPVSEEEVINELHLAGIVTENAYSTLLSLLKKYTFADDSLISVYTERIAVEELTTIPVNVFYIKEETFEKFFGDSLKNAYFILEDEKLEKGYIDAKLYSHVTQTILPGQFVTYDGKYYQAKYVTPQSGVVLRRASDLFDGRKYYRQIRRYLLNFTDHSDVVSDKKIMDIGFTEIRTDFEVVTTGYLELKENNNLRTARLVDFTDDPSVDQYRRKYHNKLILRIQLPEADDKVCFTICLLLSELFKTLFPDGWQYLAAITLRPTDISGMLNHTVYSGEGDLEQGYIYLIEDSDIDLGLLDAVEKNFMRIMEILTDFLEWHSEKMREPAAKDPVPVKISVQEAEERKKRGLVVRLLDRIRKLFGAGKKEEVDIESVAKTEKAANANEANETESESANKPEENLADSDFVLGEASDQMQEVEPITEQGDQEEDYELLAEADTEEDKSPELSINNDPAKIAEESGAVSTGTLKETEEDEFEPSEAEDPDLIHIDGTDIFDNEGMPEDNDYIELTLQEKGIPPLIKSRYQRECYLKYGFEEIDGRLRIDELRRYLRVRGWSNNSLTLARKRDILVKTQLDLNSVNHCDFCGLPLNGISYDQLSDGRIRCNNCSSSAITSVDDFRELFYRCLDLIQDFYQIKYRVPIQVRTVDAKEVAKGVGMIFKPSTEMAVRVLGFAQRKNGKYSLVVENGSPRLAAIDTIVHEMTHIWQYLNWDADRVQRIYNMNNTGCAAKARDIVYEGMAMWASIQFLYQIGETYYASEQEAIAEVRDDIYGIGFRLYRDQYPLVKDSALLKYTPFNTFPTLEPVLVKEAVKSVCTAKVCVC